MTELADINSSCWSPQKGRLDYDYTFDLAWDVLVGAQPQFGIYRRHEDACDSGRAK